MTSIFELIRGSLTQTMDDNVQMNTCWAKYLLFLVVAVLGISSMMSACGKKGDLYLPEQQQDQQK